MTKQLRFQQKVLEQSFKVTLVVGGKRRPLPIIVKSLVQAALDVPMEQESAGDEQLPLRVGKKITH